MKSTTVKYYRLFCFSAIILSLVCNEGVAQSAWYYQWGLLPDKTIDLLIGTSSGEQACNTIADLSDYNRMRADSEYTGTFHEVRYIIDKLKSYGFNDVKVERAGKTIAYHPLKGELFEISPIPDRIADIKDLPFTLIPGSQAIDSDFDLEYIGDAGSSVTDRMNLDGKVVLTSARPMGLVNSMIQKGVKGIVSFYSPRPTEDPTMIPDTKGAAFSRSGAISIFGFYISPRDGLILRERILRGEKIRLHATISYRTEEFDMQIPTCTIQGSDTTAGEIIISAHLFESFANEGANDNISGSAAILEVARVLNRAVDEGKLARPMRTIRFIWVPEYAGTIPWVKAHKDIVKKSLCDINLDMVGLSLSKYKSYFILHRTTYGNAHYINDVLENYYRYVGETNQKNSVVTGSTFFKRIVAPSGSEDPFYYQIESNSGGSDHDVFNDWGVQVPGVLLITWPDPFYHTSQDRVDKIDPTQVKRVVFITASAAYTVASAGEREAMEIAGEVYGNSIRRIGYQVSKASDEVNKCDADNLPAVLKRALSDLKGTVLGEVMTISSVTELAPGSEMLKNMIRDYSAAISGLTETSQRNILRTAIARATSTGISLPDAKPTNEEKRAMTLVPIVVSDPRDLGFNGYNEKIKDIPLDIKNRYPVTGINDKFEAAACINGKNSILDIRDILNSENKSETSLQGLSNFFYLLKIGGLINF